MVRMTAANWLARSGSGFIRGRCGENSCQPARPRIYSEVRRAEPRSRRPDPALLEPQLAPSCEFKRADIKAVDPDEWARLRSEYERQCYLDAERLARERLGQLQDAVR